MIFIGLANGSPWAISNASPSARFLSASISTISVNNPLSINANAEDEPTNPVPITATFLLFIPLLIIGPPFTFFRMTILSPNSIISIHVKRFLLFTDLKTCSFVYTRSDHHIQMFFFHLLL